MNQPWSVRMADATMMRFPLLADKWDYASGLVLKGFEQVWRATREPKYFEYIQRNIDSFVKPDGTIRGFQVGEYNVDRLNPGKVLFSLYEVSGQEKYKRALDQLRSQLDTHPRTRSGGFWHKQIYPYQMWLDGIYMADAFYAQYAYTFPTGTSPDTFDDIAHQIILIEQHTRDPKTGLLYHAWDESKQQRWANPDTGCSPNFWARAMGWYVMALVDVLDFVPHSHLRRDEIIAILNRAIAALVRVQESDTGLWYQILNNPTPKVTTKANYLESSASCMFVYAIAKGVRNHYLDRQLLALAQRAYAGIIKQFIQVNKDGQVHLTGTCQGAGLGGTPYRDGSFEYYAGEPVVTDNHHGVGAFLLASTEMERSI